MDLQDVIRRRRMVRHYTSEPVDRAIVDRVLRNAVQAPSAGFSQGWGFLVLDAPDDVARFWEAATPPDGGGDTWSRGMRTAPVIVIPLSCKAIYLDRYAEQDKGWTDRDENRWPVPYWDVDTGMAALLMLLTVTDEGLGACFFGIPTTRVAALRSAFGVPDEYTPIGAITIGHRAASEQVRGSAATRPRKTDEVIHRGSW